MHMIPKTSNVQPAQESHDLRGESQHIRDGCRKRKTAMDAVKVGQKG